ncbi:MAG: hypothetical protein F6K58_24725 [Symploca sp. SIO2E9]|nr:hypothetical protein [Symploca sp. SIO2E9]
MLGITITGATDLGDYNSRTVAIEVTGLRNGLIRKSQSTLKVPLGQLSQAMKYLKRMGGKIVSVTLVSSSLRDSEPTQPSELPVEEVQMATQSSKTAMIKSAEIIKFKPLQRSPKRLATKKASRRVGKTRKRLINNKRKLNSKTKV